MAKTFLIFLFVSLILLFSFSSHIFPFTTDSLTYISTAENISEGNGLVYSNNFVQPAEPDLIPLMIRPPGYPILIAALNCLGINAYTAALLIPRFFFLLLPVAFFLVFQHLMPKQLSMIASVLCVFMFPVIKCALMAWTDIPFLFLSLMGFFFAFKTIKAKDKEQLFWCFVSGLFIGCALLFRHAGLALLFSVGSGLLLMSVFKIIPLKQLIKVIGVFAMGVFIVYMPYLIRNYLVFGSINSYKLPPAQVSLLENITVYSQALSRMIFMVPHYNMVLITLIGGMIIFFVIKMGKLIKADKFIVLSIIILILYFLSGSFMVILFKTMYFAPEPINDRYLIQYAWVIVAGLSYCATCLLVKLKEAHAIDIKKITFLILLIFFFSQGFPAIDYYFQQRKVLNVVHKIEPSVPLLTQLPQETVIVSNVMDITYYFSRRNVRMLNGYTPYGLKMLIGINKKFAVFIVKMITKEPSAYLYPPSWRNPQGYRNIYSNRHVELWLPDE